MKNKKSILKKACGVGGVTPKTPADFRNIHRRDKERALNRINMNSAPSPFRRIRSIGGTVSKAIGSGIRRGVNAALDLPVNALKVQNEARETTARKMMRENGLDRHRAERDPNYR